MCVVYHGGETPGYVGKMFGTFSWSEWWRSHQICRQRGAVVKPPPPVARLPPRPALLRQLLREGPVVTRFPPRLHLN